MSESETNDSTIQNLLRCIREQSMQGEYIYRGEPDRGEPEKYKKISSAFYRKYEEKIEEENFDIQIAQNEMLAQVKGYTDFTDETDVLTELQHYGGKTNLIDFTTDYLIALFFACDSLPREDGRVILLNRESKQGTITSPKKNQNNRVISQKSIFFQSPKGYLEEKDSAVAIIPIPRGMKQHILNYLKKYHDITTHTIYNDIFGYIQNQEKHHGAYTEFYIGLTSHKKERYQEAIEHYDQSIEINPQNANTYYNRGAAKSALKCPAAAIADLDQALRINPQNANAYNHRGLAKGDLNRHDDAIADFDQALRIDPQDADAYNHRGLAKGDLNRHDDAIADFDQALRINPQHADAYNNRGAAKGDLNRHDDAVADFDQAIRIDPQHADAYCNRGFAKHALNRHHDAIADFDQAIRIQPPTCRRLLQQRGSQACP